jgi:MYXO-CTERM domain-containing protein
MSIRRSVQAAIIAVSLGLTFTPMFSSEAQMAGEPNRPAVAGDTVATRDSLMDHDRGPNYGWLGLLGLVGLAGLFRQNRDDGVLNHNTANAR